MITNDTCGKLALSNPNLVRRKVVLVCFSAYDWILNSCSITSLPPFCFPHKIMFLVEQSIWHHISLFDIIFPYLINIQGWTFTLYNEGTEWVKDNNCGMWWVTKCAPSTVFITLSWMCKFALSWQRDEGVNCVSSGFIKLLVYDELHVYVFCLFFSADAQSS